MDKYPFRNITFRGGGIRGLAYLGALEILDEYKILQNIERVSGTSAGSISALVTSFGLSAKETQKVANTLDYSEIPAKNGEGDNEDENIENSKSFSNLFNHTFEDLACVKRLLKQYGWYTSDYFYNWLKKTIQHEFIRKKADQTIINKNGLQTFQDFRNAGFLDLYISVTNVSKHNNEIFSIENHPDMPVADAVRISMSIPLYFQAISFNNNFYADGGITNSYPMEVFDSKQYIKKNKNFKNDINWETLGCHLMTSTKNEAEDCIPQKSEDKKDHDFNFIKYIEQLFITLLKSQEINYTHTPNLKARSAEISDCGISMIDFDIKPGDCKYNLLYNAGKKGMTEFLENFNL